MWTFAKGLWTFARAAFTSTYYAKGGGEEPHCLPSQKSTTPFRRRYQALGNSAHSKRKLYANVIGESPNHARELAHRAKVHMRGSAQLLTTLGSSGLLSGLLSKRGRIGARFLAKVYHHRLPQRLLKGSMPKCGATSGCLCLTGDVIVVGEAGIPALQTGDNDHRWSKPQLRGHRTLL